MYILNGMSDMSDGAFKTDFVLMRMGEGVVETADEDIFTDDYVIKLKSAGTYKIMTRKDYGTYRTTNKMRSITVREYAAPKDEDDLLTEESANTIAQKLEDFENSRSEGGGEEKPTADYQILRGDGDKLRVVDNTGNVLLEDFNLEQLRSAKEAFSGEKKLMEGDLKNQGFIKYVLVFLGGMATGAFVAYMFLKQKHAEELSQVNSQLNQLINQMQEMSAPKKKTYNSPEEYMLVEYNKNAEGPSY